jgi:hypothetical protein
MRLLAAVAGLTEAHWMKPGRWLVDLEYFVPLDLLWADSP